MLGEMRSSAFSIYFVTPLNFLYTSQLLSIFYILRNSSQKVISFFLWHLRSLHGVQL